MGQVHAAALNVAPGHDPVEAVGAPAHPGPALAIPPSEAVIAEGLRVSLRVMLARFPGLQRSDAEDLAQELAVEFWRHHETVKSPEAWFRACAVKKAQRFLSRRRFNDTLDCVAITAAPAEPLRELAIQQLYFTLENRCRRLLGLVVFAGCRPEELAATDDPTGRTVYRRTARCLKVLRSRWLRVTNLLKSQASVTP